LSTVLVAALLGGCGGATRDSASRRQSTNTDASETAPAQANTTVDDDHDNDVGAPYDDTNHRTLVDEGRTASPAERRAITTMVKSYYAAALAEDGARGCALLYSTLAEAAPEDESREPDTPPYMRGQTTCAGVLHAMFHHFHAQLAIDEPELEVTRIRMLGRNALVLLRFGSRERETSAKLERSIWKMSKTYDEELP
jgi:hypothetical protein